MKDFHPAAVAVDTNGRHTHYLLRDQRGARKLAESSDLPIIVLTPPEFARWVKDGKVQIFQDFGDGPVVAYTEEECAYFNKNTRRKMTLEQMNSVDYWKSECSFYNHFINDRDGVSISLMAAQKMKLAKQIVVQGAIYTKGMNDEFRALVKSASISVAFTTPDFCICNWLIPHLQTTLQAVKGDKISLCSETLTHLDNMIYEVKMMGFTPCNMDDVTYILKELAPFIPMLPPTNPTGGNPKNASSGVSRMKLG